MPNKPRKQPDRAPAKPVNLGGRPPLPPEERREEIVRVLLNPAERDELQRAADAAGVPLGTWCRLQLLAVARHA